MPTLPPIRIGVAVALLLLGLAAVLLIEKRDHPDIVELTAVPAGNGPVPAGTASAPPSAGSSVQTFMGIEIPPQYRAYEELDQLPRMTYQTRLHFPEDIPNPAARNGRATVVLMLDRSGQVARAELADLSDRELAQTVLDGVRQWKFEPARLGGESSPFWVWMDVTVRP